MRRNNKGFTLVELLAVIVILAIVALVVVPVVMNVIKDARKKSAIESFRGYMDAVEKTIIRDSMKATSELPNKDSNGCYNLEQLNPKIKVKGDKPVIVESDDKLCVQNGKIISISEVSVHGYALEYKNDQILFNGKAIIDRTIPEITFGEIQVTANSITIPYEVQSGKSGVTVTCEYGTSESYGNNGTIEDNKCILSGLSGETKYYFNLKAKTGKNKTANQASSKETLCSNYTINQQFNYSYTGGVQTFTPVCKGNYKLEVWGAAGGGSVHSYTLANGAPGGYSYGTFNNNAKSPLYIVVGGQGTYNSSASNSVYAGGYNGGGSGSGAGGGGGATHIGLKSAVLTSFASDYSTQLLLVAGGGGGANAVGGSASEAPGGAGGGTNGIAGGTTSNWGYQGYSSGPGTQSAAGTNSSTGWNGGSGGFGRGRDYYSSWNAGGGGGFYGGANGAYHGGSGAGGSGYVNTNKLSGAATIAGNQTFKAPSGSNETGHPGHGYARITYLGK